MASSIISEDVMLCLKKLHAHEQKRNHEYYVLYSTRTARIAYKMLCGITSCVTMYVKDTIHYRGLRKRSSTLWFYQATRLTPYASVTTHRTGVEFSFHFQAFAGCCRELVCLNYIINMHVHCINFLLSWHPL